MKKKSIVIMLVVALVLSLTACGSNNKNTSGKETGDSGKELPTLR